MKALVMVVAVLMMAEPAEPEPTYEVGSREWCEKEAATDSEVEYCDEKFPDMYPDEEE